MILTIVGHQNTSQSRPMEKHVSTIGDSPIEESGQILIIIKHQLVNIQYKAYSISVSPSFGFYGQGLPIDYSPVRSAGYRGDEKGNAAICKVTQALLI